MRFTACLGAGTLAGAAAAVACEPILPAALAGGLWGQILGVGPWLILDVRAERRGRSFHPLSGAAWAAGVAAVLTGFPALCLTALAHIE